MCHPCQTCDHHAQGHPAGQENPWRACLNSLLSLSVFFLKILEREGREGSRVGSYARLHARYSF